jgi:hypothetical protein
MNQSDSREDDAKGLEANLPFGNDSSQAAADKLVRERRNYGLNQSSVAGPPFPASEAHAFTPTVDVEHPDGSNAIKIQGAGATTAAGQPTASTAFTSISTSSAQAKSSEDAGPSVLDDEKQQAATISSPLSLSREPQETALRLNFEEYALAISRVFRDASGEFCMAVLGRWGSGKTRLARLITSHMSRPNDFISALDKYGLPHADTDSVRYSVVWFSAWQYRRVPEAWIYLYQTFSKVLVSPDSAALTLRMARVLRVNVARRGDFDLVFRLCALGAVLAPLQLLGGVAQLLVPVLGILGFYQLLSMMRSGPKTVKQLATDYATVAQHSEKLGLQASVGVDLRALLRGWIMRPAPTPELAESALGPLRPRFWLWAIPAVMAVIWAIGLHKGPSFSLPDWLTTAIETSTGGAKIDTKAGEAKVDANTFGTKVDTNTARSNGSVVVGWAPLVYGVL